MFETLSATGSIGLLALAASGTVLFANDTLAQIWHLPAKPRHAGDIWSHVLPQLHDPGVFMQTIESLRVEASARHEWRVRRCDNHWIDCFSAPLAHSPLHDYVRLFTFRASDFLAEHVEPLRRLHHLAQLGQAALGVGHELRNFLIPATAHARFASDELEPGHPAYEHLAGILRTTQRCHTLLEKFIANGRAEPGEMQVLRVGPLLEDMLALLRAAVDRRIDIRLNVAADVLTVAIEPAAIEQAILNLVLNAARAIDARGTIELSVAPRPWIHGKPAAVRLTVRDTGRGMDRETLAWLQGPAVVAGEAHKGLGLSIVREIVARHEAEIHIETAPGAGTAFHIDFRAVSSAVAD